MDLKKLIEQCQELTFEKDFHLEHSRNGWIATTCLRNRTKEEIKEDKELGIKYPNGKIWDKWSRGKTPEKAVYNLLRALKRKKGITPNK